MREASNDMDDEALANRVIFFTQAINDLQVRYYPLTLDPSRDLSIVLANYRADAEKVYLNYLTPKKRACYFGISSPPKYAGIDSNTPCTVDYTKNGATVTFITTVGQIDYQFTLVCQKDQWLINSFKHRYRSYDGALIHNWQYGSF
jgi:hypothetical protein